jgi:hypothetical protein
MNKDGKKILGDVIAIFEKQMKLELEKIRIAFNQSTDKGTKIEEAIKNILERYLPPRLKVSSGEIIDSNGLRSSQTDVIIVSEDHPLIFMQSPSLFIIEGVCAAGEVKTTLRSDDLDKAFNDSSKFKQLKIKLPLGTVISNKGKIMVYSNDTEGEPLDITLPWFLLAFKSDVNLQSILKKIRSYPENSKIDGIFILNSGWIVKTKSEWKCKETTETDSVLSDFILWLNSSMHRMLNFDSILKNYFTSKFEQHSKNIKC